MRVIAGEFRSRTLEEHSGPGYAADARPVAGDAFQHPGAAHRGAIFVDAYAGTGAVGIEALSRGAVRCIFLENARRAVEVIRENLHSLGIENRASVVAGKVNAALARMQADIVFLDPPYEMEAEYAAALSLAAAPLVIAQHSARFDPGEFHGAFHRTRLLKQGDNALSFYSAAAPDSA